MSLSRFCDPRVDCQWGSFGDWSECDPCTKLQARSRVIAVYPQFGGNPCSGERTETRTCETTQDCPLAEGCGDRFRCQSGKCVSQSLVCNGELDCEEDGQDEHDFEAQKWIVCFANTEGQLINTRSLGGQCHFTYSLVDSTIYRLPLSTIKYSFVVKAQNDFSDEMFSSKWHYAKDIVNRQTVTGTTSGYRNYDFHESDDRSRTHKLLVLKNEIEVAQFQSNSPQYLPIAEEFWKALFKLPSVYYYAAYRNVIERFGTHYLLNHPIISPNLFKIGSHNHVSRVDVEGGGIKHVNSLKAMPLSDPAKNWQMYSNWADSVRSFPKVIKQQLRPISELVKEVPCAGVKKLYLRRAIEQYISESDPCHCRPCRNNGMVFMDGDVCKCLCKPGTTGLACEQGTEAEGQQGVIHGSWACWSAWSSCSGGQRSRSRSCSNPAPVNGGQHCIGETSETSNCEDQDLHDLKIMEPQCFNPSLPPLQKCRTPTALINGYILDPKDIYLVGSKVEYSCTDGFYLFGHRIQECTAGQTWSGGSGLFSPCKLETLGDGVIASPTTLRFDEMELSCPEGRQLIGESVITCDSSLQFSPDLAGIKCSPVSATQQVISPVVQCNPWQKSSRGTCVCKRPFECGSSLDVCATTANRTKSVPLTVCKMHALQCRRKKNMLAADSTCNWPVRSTTGCTNCHMWETCDDQTHECRCRDSADCSSPGINVCVRVGEDATAASQTMSECEAGLQRCKGVKVTVVSILPCTA
uniref:Complement component C7 n=1 Tax=Sparus aurata TaxID=8175 RepID=A0A671V825_SPAAU